MRVANCNEGQRVQIKAEVIPASTLPDILGAALRSKNSFKPAE